MTHTDAKLEILLSWWTYTINGMIKKLNKIKDSTKRKRDRELIDMSLKLNP